MVARSQPAQGYTANKVWFEFLPTGIYRVHVSYTVPALREFREAFAEFRRKKDAERFYFDLLKGADFYIPDPKTLKMVQNPTEPEPW